MDGGLHHAERRRVGGGFGPAGLAEDRFDLGKAFQDLVLHGKEPAGLGHGDAGAADRHVEDGALIERRHELAADAQHQNDAERNQQKVDEQGGFPEAQHPADDRLVDPFQKARDGVGGFRFEALAFEKHRHQHRDQGDGEDGRGRHRKGFGEGQRAEEPALLGLQHEDGHKGDDDDDQGEEDAPAHLLAGADHGGEAVPAVLFAPFGEVAITVFHHDDGGVHQNADGQRDAAERHDVGGDLQKVHGDERDHHGDRQSEDRHEGGAEMKEEKNHHQADHHDLLDQRLLEVFDGKEDQLGTVVGGNDPDAFRQARCDLLDLRFDGVDHLEGVLAVAHHHDAAGHLAPAVQLHDPATDVGAEGDVGDVAQQHRGPALAAHHDRLDVGRRLDVAPAAHHVLPAGHLDQAAFHVVVGHLDAVHHLADGQAVGGQAIGVDVDLVLLDEPAHAGDLGHPLDAGQGVAQEPVLQGAQEGEVVRAAFIHQGVGEDPAHARRVRAEDRGGALGQPPRYLLQVFQHARARPVDVGPVLENGVDEGEPEIGKAAHGLDPRGRDEGGHDRVGDLVFDQVRAAAFPGRVDDHLHVGDVRYGVERDVPQRIHPAQGQQQHRRKHQKPVVGAAFYDFLDHVG